MSLLAYNPYCVDNSLQFDTGARLSIPTWPKERIVPSWWPRQPRATPVDPYKRFNLHDQPTPYYSPPVIPHNPYNTHHKATLYYSRPAPFNPGSYLFHTPSAPAFDNYTNGMTTVPQISIYESAFYKTHLFYEVLNLFQHDSIEKIQKVRIHKMNEIAQKLQRTVHENQKDFGERMIFQMALNKFVNSHTIQEYDKNGDEYSKIRPSTITSFYPEFHKTHRLYAVAGAFKSDGPEEIMLALEKSVLWVLREKSSSKAAQKFRYDWFNACYILLNPQRKADYDNGDRYGDLGVPALFK